MSPWRTSRSPTALEVQTTSIGQNGRAFIRRLATAVATRLACRRFKNESGLAFGPPLRPANALPKTALIVSVGMLEIIKVELALVKALEIAGYTPTVLAEPGLYRRYYRLAGVDRFVSWDEFLEPVDSTAVFQVLDAVRSFKELVSVQRVDTRVGKYAASTALRQLRLGSFDLSPSEMRATFEPYMKASLAYAAASARLIAAVKPELVLSIDPGYTPRGELYDVCLAAGIDTITWNVAHRNNTLMLKRYRAGNCDVHPASLSDDTWTRLREEPWTDQKRRMIQEELYRSYDSGDWYGEVGTQSNTRSVSREEIVQRLTLDPRRKTAVIFPHIFWDGTFFYGVDLFVSYAEWFVETVRAAAANTEVNWIIKVHPAHTVKNTRDGFHGECSEMLAIREHFGELPPHIRIMPPDSDINTFSLFEVMDYCVTVRGTVGIEAATFGIPALTAGSGRYNGRGFTVDSTSREQYLARIARIQDIPRLSDAERELAERYAYGLFVRRPLPLSTVRLEYQKDAKASPHTHVNARTPDDLRNAPDLRAFSSWVSSGREDFDAGEHAMV